MNHEDLIKETYRILIDRGVKVKIHGDLQDLTRRLSEYMGENVHISTVSNALSGYRKTKRSVQILEALKTLPPINGDYTHQKTNCN